MEPPSGPRVPGGGFRILGTANYRGLMATGKPRRGSGRRSAVAALAVAGWVGVLIVAAGPRPSDRSWIGLPALDDLMGVAFLALIVWAVAWTVRVLRFRPGVSATRPANLITLWLGLAIAIAVLLANPSIVERLLEIEPADRSESDVGETVDEESTEPIDFAITANQVYVALAAIGGWFAITALARRRTERSDTDAAEDLLVDDDFGRTIEGMVGDLELGSDPRAAVLAAYHRLERTLADAGRPRRPSETPAEHLQRVLTRLPIDRAPFVDLAHRYELARFSNQPITEADRDRSVADLAHARNDLRRLADR